MSVEIERKFLVRGDEWRSAAEGRVFRQGYLSTDRERTVRVRTVGQRGCLAVKGPTAGVSRPEYEYEIPYAEAQEMLDRLCLTPLIEKTRYRIPRAGLVWEVDEFHGANQGLVLAEVELEAEDQPFDAPSWIGEEVSGDPKYQNANLVAHPFKSW